MTRTPLTRTTYRFRLAGVCLALVTLSFLQEPGRIAADTKLDLSVNPGGFLLRALHLWDSSAAFGQLQNQAYGYLFPVGPFFAGLHAAGVVPWVVQRAWWSIVLVVGFLGFVRLARLMGIESALARVLGGLGFVLGVRMLTELTVISAEAWPMALAPWLLVPLAYGSTRGSPRRCAAASALVFLLTGSINAVASAAIVLLGVTYLATRAPGPRRRALSTWWIVGIGLASLWWLVPLALLSRYSPPFLDWIESAAVTTSQNDPTSVLRGASQWVPYLTGPAGPEWPAGWALVSSPPLVAASAVLVLLGLAGLLGRAMPERGFLVVTLSLGLVLAGLGHISVHGISGPGAHAIRELLDGAAAALRNNHKFQPLVSLALMLGLASLVDRLRACAWAVSPPRPGRFAGGTLRGRPAGPVAATVACACAVAVAAGPALSATLVGGRSFVELPGYWRDAAGWLDERGGRALVVPSASFGVYLWGRSQDEPLQPLETQSWAVRDAVPLSSAGNIRLLDQIQQHLDAGTGTAGLAGALSRSGVRWLVVRNDLDTQATGATSSVLVAQALGSAEGITAAVSFGPVLPGGRIGDRVVDDGLVADHAPIEVYAVAPDPQVVQGRVALRDASQVVTVIGSTESLPGLVASGILGARPMLTQGDPLPAGSESIPVLTDTFRRAEVSFGAAQRNRSNTLTSSDPWRSDRRVHDYLPDDSDEGQARARLVGAVSVEASSAGASPFAPRARTPSAQPWSALDGDPQTAWVSGDVRPGVGQWWELTLAEPVQAAAVEVRLVRDSRVGSPPTEVRVVTDRGSRLATVAATDQPQALALPAGPTTRVRIELVAVKEGGPGQGFGISELTIPGVSVQRPIVLAEGPAAGGLVLGTGSLSRESCVSTEPAILCSPTQAVAGEERAGIDRIVTVPDGGRYDVRTVLRPRPGSALDAYLAAPDSTVVVTASSQSSSDPAVRAQAAADRDPRTTWTASALDTHPSLVLRLPTRQPVTGLRLLVEAHAAVSSPFEVRVSADDGPSMTLFTDDTGRIALPGLEAQRLSLTFGAVNPVRAIDGTGASRVLPVGVSEVLVEGGADRRMQQPADSGVPVPCGFGPVVTVDGGTGTLTDVRTTAGAILEGRLAAGSSCAGALELAPGEHRIQVAATREWTPEAVYLVPVSAAGSAASAAAVSPPTIGTWSDTHRTVEAPLDARPRVLELTENFNAGWSASVAGRPLEAFRADGWRQGFVLPAGTSGAVDLVFEPDRTYRLGLLAGLVAALALLGLALLPDRGPRPARVLAGLGRWTSVAPVLAIVLLAGLPGLVAAAGVWVAAWRSAGPRSGLPPWLRGPRMAAFLGLLGVGAALASFVVLPWPSTAGVGRWHDLLSVVGPAMALAALAIPPASRFGRPVDEPTSGSAAPAPPS